MTSCCSKNNDQADLPIKTVLRKIRDKYKAYCTSYKTHTMTTCHGGAGHTGIDKDLNSHREDAEGIEIGPDNDNKSTSISDTTIAFGRSEADGHPSNQARLTALMREIHSLQQ